jgi:tetratricopeptide (TPR) repeat protein
MATAAKIIAPFLLSMIFIIGCTDKNKGGNFDELLSKPPFASITDSIKQEPSNDSLYFRRAVLLNTNNLLQPALADFEKAWSLSKKEPYALGVGNILLDRNADSAILFMQQAAKELPASQLLKITLARALNFKGKTDEAIAVCNDVLQQNPQQVDILKIKAALLSKKGNEAEAISLLEKAYQLTPYDIELNYELAFKFAETKNPKVITLCDSLARMDTSNSHAEPAYYKGIYYSNTGDKQKALASFTKAIQQDYYYLNAHIEKGRVLYDLKKYPEAFATFKLCNTLSPDFADAWFWMGKCQEAVGQTDEAKLNYQKAYGLDNSFTEAKEAVEKLK